MKIGKVIKYFAVLVGFQLSIGFILLLISKGFIFLISGKTEVLPILILMIVAVSGYFLSFKHSAKGSLIMIAAGLCMSIYLIIIGGFSEIKMAMIFGIPFIISGLLLYFTPNKDEKILKL